MDDYEKFPPAIQKGIREMEDCRRWYDEVLSHNLTAKEKDSLFRRISRYWGLKGKIPDENLLSDFPELEKYWNKESISGLELYTIFRHLDHDLRPRGDAM